jgi:hypothetical protein
MVLHSEVEKYLAKKPGSTVEELAEMHYGKIKDYEKEAVGISYIACILLDLMAEGKVRAEQNKDGKFMLNRYYLNAVFQ